MLRLTVEREVNVDLEETWKSNVLTNCFKQQNLTKNEVFSGSLQNPISIYSMLWILCGFFFRGNFADSFGGLLLNIGTHIIRKKILFFHFVDTVVCVHVLMNFNELFPKNRTD